MNTRSGVYRRVLAGALCALASTAALAQTVAPIRLAKDDPPPTREWREVLRETKSKTWDVTLAVKTRFDGRGVQLPHQPPPGTPKVSKATFVLPWVKQSATQRGDGETVKMRGWLDLEPMDQPWQRLESPPGLERLEGVHISAPDGQTFDFFIHPDKKRAVRKVMPPSTRAPASGMKIGGKPSGTQNASPTVVKTTVDASGLFAQFEIRYTTTSHRVKLDRDVADHAGWPASWPPEAMGAFEKQAYLDTDFDPATGEVYDLDPDALDDLAHQVLQQGGLQDAKQVSPVVLAEGVANSVLPSLQVYGGAQLFATANFRNDRGDAVFIDLSPGGEVPMMEGLCAGFFVRNTLEIVESGRANDAERAVVLAAIYRRLGLPARVMIGYEAEEDAKEKLAKRLQDVPPEKIARTPEGLRKQIEEDNAEREKNRQESLAKNPQKSQPLMWPHLPPFKFVIPKRMQVKPKYERPKWGGYRPTWGGGRPRTGYKPRVYTIVVGPDLTPKAEELLRNSRKLKRVKFWIEFALYDPERGLAWVPVDCGSGARDFRFGEVEDAERYVAVATGFWPTQIQRLYVFGEREQGHADESVLFGLDPRGKIFDFADLLGLSPQFPPRMPAAFWGMFTEPETARVVWQEVGFTANRAVVTGAP